MRSPDRVLRHLCKLTGQSCTVNSFSPGGKRIVSAWYDYPDKIWDAELETEVRNFLLGVVMVPGVGHLVVLSGQLKPDMCRKWWEEGGWLCRCTRWCRVQGSGSNAGCNVQGSGLLVGHASTVRVVSNDRKAVRDGTRQAFCRKSACRKSRDAQTGSLVSSLNGVRYMCTSLVGKRIPLGPYRRPMPRVLGGS